MDLEKILQDYGLTIKQSKVYLACLADKSGTVQNISKLCGIPRSTTYEILDELKNKGLVSSIQKRKIHFYSAVNPKQIISQAKSTINSLENAMPGFMALYNSNGVKPSIRFYEGLHNLNIMWEEILKEAKHSIVFSAADDYTIKLGDDFKNFLTQRSKKGITSRVILQNTAYAKILQLKDKEQNRQSKISPKNYFHHSSIYVWNNKVGILNVGKDYSLLIIESEDVSLFFKNTFDLIWDLLP